MDIQTWAVLGKDCLQGPHDGDPVSVRSQPTGACAGVCVCERESQSTGFSRKRLKSQSQQRPLALQSRPSLSEKRRKHEARLAMWTSILLWTDFRVK